ncbi:pre-apoferritin [Volvox carteri f. nagariensis]|uniref:Ferritin n=1 Tax=Volvox carteri f. nagariensis TaxID=3068 RepID=D8TR55_VOLCA|nr:pre-apoferritin [Volvox carteri f. nagariensis]EFJ50140.1 pre-apoferritin [Volvox carteri f. nagariensis]|eukprot:XP_002948760.1 pre-apoferritin [Volvox carteri f. nagariensis]
MQLTTAAIAATAPPSTRVRRLRSGFIGSAESAAAAVPPRRWLSGMGRRVLPPAAAVPPFKGTDGTSTGGSAAAGAAGAVHASQTDTQTGLVFQPIGEEVRPLVADLDEQLMNPASEPGCAGTRSMARSGYSVDVEAAFNEQISIELTMSYIYTSMYAFFSRDDVGLPGFAAYFRHNSDEERHHARLLLDYQTQRGGRVKLLPLAAPETEYWHAEKGDALHATELALSLEKLNFTKLRELHTVAQAAGDADATHFIEDYLLHEQSKDVKAAAVLVSQVHRAGRGHGVFHLDRVLSEEYGNKEGVIA